MEMILYSHRLSVHPLRLWLASSARTAHDDCNRLLFLSALLSWVMFTTFSGDPYTLQFCALSKVVRCIRLGDPHGPFDRDYVDRDHTVSALVHLYSLGYMDNDPQWKEGESYKPRFFAYLIILYLLDVDAGDV